jgi:two-component sensor histidine kinase
MREELRYLKLSDEEALREMRKRLRSMKRLLEEIRDALKTLGGD